MWCRQCQQDVPVSRSMTGGAACPRCRAPLKALAPTDAGLELQSFDPRPAAPIQKPWELDSSAADLRRIGRRLRPYLAAESISTPTYDATPAEAAPPELEHAGAERGQSPLTPKTAQKGTVPADDDAATRRMLGPTIVIDLGLLTLIGGAAAMAVRTQAPFAEQLWQGGLAGVAGGAAMLVAGLIWQVVGAVTQTRLLRHEVAALRAQVTQLKAAAAQHADGTAQGDSPLLLRGLRKRGQPSGREPSPVSSRVA